MFQSIITEFEQGFISTPGPDFATLCVRLIGALLLCGVIGLEREVGKNTVGLRTNVMVGIASAAFALVTLTMLEGTFEQDKVVKSDPLRLIEAVTGGVAFLAAGAIVFTKGRVKGVTTGASLWLSAAIGLAAGLGYWNIAVLTTILGFIVLTFLNSVKEKMVSAQEDE